MHEIIERAGELAAVDRFLHRASLGPAALLLTGPPGIGKTIVWEAARIRARERSFHVLSARPARAESALPLAGFGDLFSGVPPALLARLPGPQRRALEVALLRAEPTESVADQRALSVATTALLRALARAEGPVLVAIDDAHWLDDSSSAILAFAVRRLLTCPVGLLLAWREDGGCADPLGTGAALSVTEAERCPLAPLPGTAIRRILCEELGQALPRLAVAKIEEAAGGNPLYALEIGRALIRSAEPVLAGGPLPVPRTLAALTGERISALPQSTRAALLTAALAAEPTLSVLLAAGVAEPLAALAPAVRDGIAVVEADVVSISHPLLSTTVVALAAPSEVRAVHRALAGADGPEEARALHLGMAAEGPDGGAADALAEAAARAGLRGAPAAAAELLEAARALTPGGPVPAWADRTYRAASCYARAGDLERARVLLSELAAGLPAGRERARAVQLLGQISARSASFADALVLAVAALADAGPDRVLRAEIELDIAFDSLSLGDLGDAAEHARACVLSAEAADDPGLLAQALACQTVIEFLAGAGLSHERMARALALEDPRRPAPLYARPHFVAALLQLFTCELDSAVRALSGIWHSMVDCGQEIDGGLLSVYLTWALLWHGDPQGAARVAAQAQALAALNPDPVTRAVSLTAAALVGAHQGDLARARADGHEAVRLFESTQWASATIWPLWALGFAELSVGEHLAVDGLLGPLAGLLTAMPSAAPILGLFLPDEIEALAGLGELQQAERLTDWLAAVAGAHPAGTRPRSWPDAAILRCRGILAAARGDLASALAALDRGVEVHRHSPMPVEHARTLLVKGQVHRRRREKRLADESLREALEIFERLGYDRWVERARAELRRIGLRPHAPAGLTETERRVAELAARGLTNREVAEAAFLSPKTVGNVLGRVYRKLEIGSRAELGARMAPEPADRV